MSRVRSCAPHAPGADCLGRFQWGRSRWQSGSAALALAVAGRLAAQSTAAPPPLVPMHLTGRPVVPQPTAAAPLVLDGVTVIDVERSARRPVQRVVIVGNRIQTIGPRRQVRLPRGARVIQAQGQYLIPGLWDLHVHPMRLTPLLYPLFLANGVTGVRDAGSPVPLDTLRLWRQAVLAGEWLGPPRQLFSSKALDDAGAVDCATMSIFSHHRCVADTAAARRLVDSLKAAGIDMLKMYGLSDTMYFALAAEARRVGLPFGGHVTKVTPLVAADSGAAIIDHLWPAPVDHLRQGDQLFWHQRCWGPQATVVQCQPVVERFRRTGTWLTPTFVVGPIASTPIVKRIQAYWTDSVPQPSNWLRNATDVLSADPADTGTMRIMQRVGFPVLAGSDFMSFNGDQDWQWVARLKDSLNQVGTSQTALSEAWASLAGAGFALQVELAEFVMRGLTPLAALQTATLNPAKMWHATDSLGTVAAGKLADLVLLDADPLADITNTTTVRAVIANGRYYDRTALDGVLIEQLRKLAP